MVMTFIYKNRCIKHLIIILSIWGATSCREVWDLKIDGDNSEVAHTLCVAANATIAGGELSFAAAVTPVISHVATIESYPLESLFLELNVDGLSYNCDKMVRDSLFGGNPGFILNGIPVTSDAPEVALTISDKAGNYQTVSAARKALGKPQIDVNISAIQSENWYTDEEIEYYNNDNSMDPNIWIKSDYGAPDSLYRADIRIHEHDNDIHYYLLSIEFEWCNHNSFNINSYNYFNQIRNGYNPSIYSRIGPAPYGFNSDDILFYDSRIKSSIYGFSQYFNNVFSNEGSQGKDLNASVYFKSPLRELIQAYAQEHMLNRAAMLSCFFSNAQAPFHLYLCHISAETYDHYTSVQNQLCSSGSVFGAVQHIPSNIEGGIGYFSIHNMQDFLHYDNTIYNWFVREVVD